MSTGIVHKSGWHNKPPSKVVVVGDVAQITLACGRIATVDAADAELVSEKRWHICRGVGTDYAITRINGRRTYLHRLLLNPAPRQDVDHRNRNGLDNRRANLRLCTDSQNSANRTKFKNDAKTKYKGVYLQPRTGRFEAGLKFQFKCHYLGTFDTQEEAAQAYDRKAIECFGEFACTNFPRSNYELAIGNQTVV